MTADSEEISSLLRISGRISTNKARVGKLE
jgi:hypothetical protein